MIQEKLKTLGISIPPVNPPLASYIPAKKSGNLLFISGQLPLKEGKLLVTGPMTPERNQEEVIQAMGQCFLNGLASATTVCSLDDLKGVVRLGAFVASTDHFFEQHKIANGASDLSQKIFGDSGIHSRSAVGVPSLPMNATVELEIIFQL
ncbi:MAG: RidA family protein [Spirochaetia bacterium]|nr:RidA family protein [Spirochaetia bacterium]